MEIASGLLHGFAVALQPSNVFWCFVGCLLGTVVGIMPGLGPAATIALLPWWRGSSPGAFLNDAPTGVVTAVRAQPPGSRVFAPQVWGSWFEREAPDQLPFLDSRIELYPPPLWQDYVTMYNAKPGWEAAMTRWRVSVVALPNDAPLESVIGHTLGWTQIYRGTDGAVFVAGGATGGV